MAAGTHSNVHDDHGHDAPIQDHPDHVTAIRGGHDAHEDDHGHGDDHGSGGDAWVIPPLVIGLVIGLIIAVLVGFQSGATPFN